MPWQAIQTFSNHEARVDQELARLGIEHYLPVLSEKRQRFDRRVYVDVPLFPGYTFAQTELSPELKWKLGLYGACAYIGHVSDEEMASIRQMIAGGARRFDMRELTAGTKVVIKHGPLAGIYGTFLRAGRHGRLVLEVNLLRAAVSAEIEERWVQVVR